MIARKGFACPPCAFRIKIHLNLTANSRRKCRQHPVIIAGRNWVEFVVVTARTADGQAEHRRTRRRKHVVHRIVTRPLNLAGRDLGRKYPSSQKSGGRQGKRIVRLELVARQLPADKLVVRHVRIQRFDDKIPIMIRMRTVIIMLEPRALSKAGDIQPVTRPTLAVAWAVE